MYTLAQVDNINTALIPKLYFEFNGTQDLFEWIDKAKPWNKRCSSIADGKTFSGTESLKEAKDLLVNGWPEGRDKMHDLAVQVGRGGASMRHKYEHGVTGFMPDVPRMLGGDPNHMVGIGEEFTVAQQYEIVVNTCYSASTSHTQLFNYGACVVKLIDTLEARGDRVRLLSGQLHSSPSNNPKLALLASMKIKDYDDPLEVDRVAFALCHPSFLRRLGFAIIERADPSSASFVDAYHSGYGQIAPLTPEHYSDGRKRIVFRGINYEHRAYFDKISTAIEETHKILAKNGHDDIHLAVDNE